VLLALQEGLRVLGYIERQNYVLVPRRAVREGGEMLSAARDLVGQNVDIVMVGSNELAEAFKMATSTVPGEWPPALEVASAHREAEDRPVGWLA
jgi:hypothetical protein